jgi:DNA recombination protein RmuC
MNSFSLFLYLLAGLALGVSITWLTLRSRATVLAQRKLELEQELNGAGARLQQMQAEFTAIHAAKAAAEATLESERSSTKEKLDLLAADREEMAVRFKVLATSALENNNASFLQLANATLRNYQNQAVGELAQKEIAVKNLVDPIAQSLREMNHQIQELEQARSGAYGSLSTQVVALQAETGNLVRALRDPQTRGRWGELQLRRVLELAGMLEYCDFEQQVSVTTDSGRLRPDVVVRLPGAKNIVIDAKSPIQRYLDAVEATDETTRNACFRDHARLVRSHIDDLGDKAYWAQFQPTPEFVLMFIPGEAFFRAAVMADSELLEYGGGKVILTSPLTLIAVLKTIAYGWNQQNLAESARKISEAGKTLYQRLAVMAYHFQDIGKRLDAAVESYDKAVGSMERSVFPIARKLPELDRSLSSVEVPELQQIEKTPRRLASPDWELQSEIDPLLFESEDADFREP